MLSSNYCKGYVRIRQGLFIYPKYFNHVWVRSVSYSKSQNNESNPVDDYSSASIDTNDISSSNREMRLRDFLNCFYVSGWVPFYLMKETLTDFSTGVPESISADLGSILLKCSGHVLATCNKQTRINVTTSVWNCLNRDADFGLDQYHILLNVDAENSFYRPGLLQEIEERGLMPSQTTYELVLQSASESKNNVAFDNVKSLMEQKGFDFTENFMSSMIRLQALNQNLDEIRSLHNTLWRAERSMVIGFALMRAYASLNNYTLLMKVLNEILSSGKELESYQLAHVTAELAFEGSKDKVTKFVDDIHSLGLKMKTKDVNWLTAYLSSRELEDVAYRILKKMSWLKLPDVLTDSPPTTLVSVTSAFWQADKAPEALFDFIDSVKGATGLPWLMESALYGALRHPNARTAWIILDEMHKRDKTPRSHFFWPLICSSTSSPKEILDVIKKMLKYGVKPDTETLKSFVIGRLLPLGVDPDYLLDRIVGAGVRTKDAVLAFDIYFLENDQMHVALQRHSRPSFEGNTEFVDALSKCYLRTNDGKSMVSFLKTMESDRVTRTDWVGQVLLDVYSKSPERGEALLQNMRSSGVNISRELGGLVKALRKQSKVQEEEGVDDVVDNMACNDSGTVPRMLSGAHVHPAQMNVDELENHLEELRSKRFNTRQILRRLFLHHTGNRNLTRAKQLLDDLQEIPNVEWSAGMLSSKLQLCAMLGDTEESLQTLSQIKTKFPRFSIDYYKLMSLAECLARDNRLKDAMAVLEDMEEQRNIPKDLTASVVLVETFIQKDVSVDDLRKVLSLLMSKKCVPRSNPLLGRSIDYHLQRGDLEGAVKEFESLYKHSGVCPNTFNLLSALHTAKLKGQCRNFEELRQFVVRILKHTSLYHLDKELFPAAHAGDEEDVLFIMRHMLKHGIWRRDDWQCRRWATTGNIMPLELIFSTARKLEAKSMDMSAVVQALADEYYFQGDSRKLSELCEVIKQKEVFVGPKVSRSVHRLSKSCGSVGKDNRDNGVPKILSTVIS